VLAAVHAYALVGIEAIPVRVEVDLSTGALPGLVLVGLPDAAVRESRERIVAALRNQGLRFPDRKITVNLAPADLRKEGVGFDLPIAVGVLVASGQAPGEHVSGCVWSGELSLEGRVRPVRGGLCMAMAERARGAAGRALVLPSGNGAEARAAGGVRVREVGSLKEVVRILHAGIGREEPDAGGAKAPPGGADAWADDAGADMLDVRGQVAARRALEVAAAGGHNVLFIGSPGTGKSMLAERIPGILPPLTQAERIEATMVHSAAGLLEPGAGLVRQRPFRAPHHTTSQAGLVGGGRPPRPGEISLAHRGVLFLDELPEFQRCALESLRQPLETGEVRIVRAGCAVRFPARFQLVAAMNPCPCGKRLDPRGGCRCGAREVERYMHRISGPLLERIDIHIEMAPVSFQDMTLLRPAEGTLTLRGRVSRAWERQRERFTGHPRVLFNAQMALGEIREHCRIGPRPLGLLRMAVQKLGLSPRAYHKVLRLSRTIADLAGADEIAEAHVAEAIAYRVLDREGGG